MIADMELAYAIVDGLDRIVRYITKIIAMRYVADALVPTHLTV